MTMTQCSHDDGMNGASSSQAPLKSLGGGGPAWPFLLRPAPKAGRQVVGEPVFWVQGPLCPLPWLGDTHLALSGGVYKQNHPSQDRKIHA